MERVVTCRDCGNSYRLDQLTLTPENAENALCTGGVSPFHDFGEQEIDCPDEQEDQP